MTDIIGLEKDRPDTPNYPNDRYFATDTGILYFSVSMFPGIWCKDIRCPPKTVKVN